MNQFVMTDSEYSTATAPFHGRLSYSLTDPHTTSRLVGWISDVISQWISLQLKTLNQMQWANSLEIV